MNVCYDSVTAKLALELGIDSSAKAHGANVETDFVSPAIDCHIAFLRVLMRFQLPNIMRTNQGRPFNYHRSRVRMDNSTS